MAFTNLATEKILSNKQINNGPLSTGFIYPKFAWFIEISQAEKAGGENSADAGTPVSTTLDSPVFNDNILNGVGSAKDSGGSMQYVAKTCELPRWTAETQVVNAYNHKTIVQTKFNYEPIAISFYDQTNNLVESMIWNYVKGQFDPNDGSKKAGISPLTIKITMRNLSGEGEDRIYTLTNAFITDAQHDTADYTSSDPILWTITVRYEALDTTDFAGAPETITTGIAKKEKPKKEIPVPPSKPKPDAKEEAEPPMYTDPMGTTDGAAIMAVAGNSPKKSTPETSWPADNAWTRAGGGQTGGGAAFGNPNMAKQGKNYSPSAGSNAPSQTSSLPSRPLTSKQQSFIDQQQKEIDSTGGLNDKWKQSYMDNLKKHPPLTNTPQSQLSAREYAKTLALRDAPMYASQVRTVDNGVYVDRATITPGQPGTSNTSVNNTQLSRENSANNNKAQSQRTF